MNVERRISNIWSVDIDKQLPTDEIKGHSGFITELAKIPMEARYNLMSKIPVACVLAVHIWKDLQPLFSDYEFGDQVFTFDREVQDHYGYLESGQDMLKVQKKNSHSFLVADVAGYLFGFGYQEMLIAAGDKDYISMQVSKHYSQKYPNLNARAFVK